MQRMLNKDLTRFMYSLSREQKSSKQKKGSAGRVVSCETKCFLSLLTDAVESAMTEICESKEELKYSTVSTAEI